MEWTGERIIWNRPGKHLSEFKKCVNWYIEAMEYAKGKRVVDAACGTGFGTFLLATVASEVFGIEISAEAFEAAERQLPFQSAIKFLEIDLEKEPVDITADLCVSIETIEHLANPDFFLENLKAKALFFSIPCYGNKNEFHKIEYDEAKAAELIRRHYSDLTYRMENRRMIGYATRPARLP